MKRNSVYIIGEFNPEKLKFFKKDLIDQMVEMCLRIKKLGFVREEIEVVVKNAVDKALVQYNPKKGHILGDIVKTFVFADLRAEYAKAYPNRVNGVRWPDLAQKGTPNKHLQEILKLKLLPNGKRDSLLEKLSEELTERQQQLLSTIFSETTSIVYTNLAKIFHTNRSIISNEIQKIYLVLNKHLKD